MTDIRVIRGDITKWSGDAIITAASHDFTSRSGLQGTLIAAAGPKMFETLKAHVGGDSGDVLLTPGFQLAVSHVIHAISPVWHGGYDGEQGQLESCYRKAL